MNGTATRLTIGDVVRIRESENTKGLDFAGKLAVVIGYRNGLVRVVPTCRLSAITLGHSSPPTFLLNPVDDMDLVVRG